jgi:hypothetical protein
MSLTSQAIQEAAERGFEYIKVHRPDALNNIDRDYFDIVEYDSCMLGQGFGSYNKGMEALGLTVEQANELGFNLPDGYNAGEEAWQTLQEAWEYILEREGVG